MDSDSMREVVQIVYTWPNGREEIRYERPMNSDDAKRMMEEVENLRARGGFLGYESPYSYRFV